MKLSSYLKLLLLLPSVVPLVIVTWLGFESSTRITNTLVEKNFSTITSFLADDVESMVTHKKNNLQFLTHLLSVKESIIEEYDKDGLLAELFVSFVDENPEFSEVYALRNTGTGFVPFASSNSNRMSLKTEITDELSKIVRRGGKQVDFKMGLDQIVSTAKPEKKAFRLIVPFVAEDEEIHFLVGLIDVNQIQSKVESLKVHSSAQGLHEFILVFDQNHNLLFHPEFLKDSFTKQHLQSSLSNLSIASSISSLKGINYCYHRHDSNLLGWQILVLQDEKVTFSWRSKLFKWTLFILLLTIIVILWGNSKLVKKFVNDIQSLEDAASEYSKSNFQYQVNTSNITEIQSVGNSFEKMAKSLNSAQDELKEFTDQLENLVEKRTSELQEKNSQLDALSNKLSKYLAPQLYKSIFKGSKEVKLGASRKKLTVFFSDIKNFTSTSEQMESEDLTKMLNSYLEEMAKIALEFGGTIDKFIGDAVMVFFGDPNSLGEDKDALQCVLMALRMQQVMIGLRSKWEKEGFADPFHIRCGVNSGYCTVGNFGSSDRMDYTIIGKNVNLAARLESSASPDSVLISTSTYNLIKEFVEVESKEPIHVKGIDRPIQTYEVLASKESSLEDSVLFHDDHGLLLQADFLTIPNDRRNSLKAAVADLVSNWTKSV